MRKIASKVSRDTGWKSQARKRDRELVRKSGRQGSDPWAFEEKGQWGDQAHGHLPRKFLSFILGQPLLLHAPWGGKGPSVTGLGHGRGLGSNEVIADGCWHQIFLAGMTPVTKYSRTPSVHPVCGTRKPGFSLIQLSEALVNKGHGQASDHHHDHDSLGGAPGNRLLGVGYHA